MNIYLRLGDSRISRAQPRINAYEILLQHDRLLLLLIFVFLHHAGFEINAFYFTYLDKLFFLNNKTFPL